MRIMVFDVPAEHGGALSILKEYYDKAVADKNNEWIFIVSKPELDEKENISVERHPWTKKSWLHRLYFDNFYSRKLVKKYKPDKILSLQNTLVKGKGVFQELYVHQPLPFCEKRYSLKENKKFWVYQNIISKFIIRSVRKADLVTVQTKWMKEAVIRESKISESKIQIIHPEINILQDVKYKDDQNSVFFYPASSAVYKNHKVIYEACMELKKKGYKDFTVILTIKKPANFMEKYHDIDDVIQFRGRMEKEDVYKTYAGSVLLFPSYIETFGLPLLEARTIGSPVIASDCAFSKEILEGYDKACFLNPHDKDELSMHMENYIKSF